jgi:RHS repeat-associated protein
VSSSNHEPATQKRFQIRYYQNDQIGTPRELTDQSGAVRWAATYKTWGNVETEFVDDTFSDETLVDGNTVKKIATQKVKASARTVDSANNKAIAEANAPLRDGVHQPLRFQGQYFDEETGLHYNRFRYYDPDCGRFVSQDPIALSGGSNLFLYSPNPTNWTDPFGLKPCKPSLVRYKPDKVTPQVGSYTTGINRAWALEKKLIEKTGFGTVDWTPAQLDLIKSTKNADLTSTMSNAGFTGHHINNAAKSPGWEGDPRNIAFLSNGPNGGDHLHSNQGHRGNWQNETNGRLIDREEMMRQWTKAQGC